MNNLAIVVLLFVMIAGYGILQQYRERKLAERLKNMRDANSILSEMDSVIAQSRQEAEIFKRNSGRRS